MTEHQEYTNSKASNTQPNKENQFEMAHRHLLEFDDLKKKLREGGVQAQRKPDFFWASLANERLR